MSFVTLNSAYRQSRLNAFSFEYFFDFVLVLLIVIWSCPRPRSNWGRSSWLKSLLFGASSIDSRRRFGCLAHFWLYFHCGVRVVLFVNGLSRIMPFEVMYDCFDVYSLRLAENPSSGLISSVIPESSGRLKQWLIALNLIFPFDQLFSKHQKMIAIPKIKIMWNFRKQVGPFS